MSLLCVNCPVCGAEQVSTRVITPMLAECKCHNCHYVWKVPVERHPEYETE